MCEIRLAESDDIRIIVDLLNEVTLSLHQKKINSKAGFDYCGDFKEEDYMISVFKYQ